MSWVAVAIGGSAALGAYSGAEKAKQAEAQRREDLMANAIEAKYSWLLDSNPRNVTQRISRQGAIAGGAMSGALTGASLAGAMGKAGIGGGAGSDPGAVVMDPQAKATQLAPHTAAIANRPENYTSSLNVSNLMTDQGVPQSAWQSKLSPAMSVDALGGPPPTAPNLAGGGYFGDYGSANPAQGPTPYQAGGQMIGPRYMAPMSTQPNSWTPQTVHQMQPYSDQPNNWMPDFSRRR